MEINAYYYSILRECVDNYINNSGKFYDDLDCVKLSKYKELINKMQPYELMELIQYITPERHVKILSLSDLHSYTTSNNEFSFFYFGILNQLPFSENLKWIDEDNLVYAPSTIISGKSSLLEVIYDIQKNISHIKQLPDYFITSDLDTDIAFENGDKVRLISLENAKLKLCKIL